MVISMTLSTTKRQREAILRNPASIRTALPIVLAPEFPDAEYLCGSDGTFDYDLCPGRGNDMPFSGWPIKAISSIRSAIYDAQVRCRKQGLVVDVAQMADFLVRGMHQIANLSNSS